MTTTMIFISLLSLFMLGVACLVLAMLVMEDDAPVSNPVKNKVVKDKAVKAKAEKQKMNSTKEELDFLEDLLGLESQHEPKPKKTQVSKQKVQDYCDILKAIGFSASEAKEKVTKLLTENPDATEIELLRKATDK